MIRMILLSWNCYHRIKWVRSSMLCRQYLCCLQNHKNILHKEVRLADDCCWLLNEEIKGDGKCFLNFNKPAQLCIVTIQHVQGSRQTSQLYAEVDILIKRKHVSTDSVFLQTQLLLTTLLTDDQVDTLENINDGQDMIEIVARCDWLSYHHNSGVEIIIIYLHHSSHTFTWFTQVKKLRQRTIQR